MPVNTAVFVTVCTEDLLPDDLKTYFLEDPLRFVTGLEAVEAVEIYVPAQGEVPRMDDIPAPAISVQIDLNSAAAAKAMVSDAAFKRLFSEADSLAKRVKRITLEIVEPVHYPLPGYPTPPPRTAAMSFVVRYYGPTKNLSDFVNFYTENHPPLLAQFPGIRNVLCYLPLDWDRKEAVVNDDLVIGNEVVFDDLEALNHALDSDILAAVMADSEKFADYGYSSHHAMDRVAAYRRY